MLIEEQLLMLINFIQVISSENEIVKFLWKRYQI